MRARLELFYLEKCKIIDVSLVEVGSYYLEEFKNILTHEGYVVIQAFIKFREKATELLDWLLECLLCECHKIVDDINVLFLAIAGEFGRRLGF